MTLFQKSAKWLKSVVGGHFRYFGVPGNRYALAHFRFTVSEPLASHSLTAKPEGSRSVGANATAHPPLAASGPYLPSLSFAPSARHYLRQEPDAGNPPVRICAGGTEQSVSLPRPHFFRCEAPRSYNSPYSRASASHRRRTCGACHARRNSFLMDCQSSPRKLNVIPLSRARKFTPISSFSSATVYARK